MKTRHLTLASTLVLACAAAQVDAQQSRIVRNHPGVLPSGGASSFGLAIEPLGDVDGDQVADYAIADPVEPLTTGAPIGSGSVRAFSGATGAQLWVARGAASVTNCSGSPSQDQFGISLAVLPDVDGDLFPDLAVGAPGRTQLVGGCQQEIGAVQILSGTDGSTLLTISGGPTDRRFGLTVCSVNGLLLASVSELGAVEAVREFDPVSGQLLFRQQMTGIATYNLHAAGDLNGDGVGDLAVAQVATSAGPAGIEDQVLTIDMVTKAAIAPPIVGPSSGLFSFGTSLATLPGVGAGGNDVLLVNDPAFLAPGNATGIANGQILQFDALATPSITQLRQGADSEVLGSSLDAGGDLDGDGQADVVWTSGSPLDNFTTTTFQPVDGVTTTFSSQAFGRTGRVRFHSNVTGGAYDEFLLQSSDPNSGDAAVDVVSGGPAASGNANLGAGCSRSSVGQQVPIPALTQNGLLIPDASFSFTVGNLFDNTGNPAFQILTLQVGFPNAAGTPIGGAGSCLSFLAGPPQSLATVFSPPNPTFNSQQFSTPANLNLLGLTLAYQAFALPVGGGLDQIAASNAVSATVGW